MAQTSRLARMQSPLRPPGEAARLKALRRYDVLDTPAERALDDLAGLAAQLCEAPIALITFVDERRQWFKAKVRMGGATGRERAGGGDALDGEEVARDLSFCGHAIINTDPQTDSHIDSNTVPQVNFRAEVRPDLSSALREDSPAELFIVPDAANDERFSGNPMVVGAPHIRFYAGAPLITPDGHALGTLCVMDRVPRRLNPAQHEALRALARQVMAQLELRRHSRAVLDNTTRKQVEADLRLFVQRLTLATDAASIGIWDWDLTNDQWYASPVYCSMLGYPPDRGASDRAVWLQRLHPDDQAGIAEKISAVVAGGTAPYQYEARMRHADGSYRWISVLGRVLTTDEQGKATRLLGVRMDITPRKLAELRIQQLNRVYAVLSHINETIVREKDSQAMLSAACRIAVEKGLFRLAWIGLVDAGRPGELEIAAHAGATEDTLILLRSLLDGRGEGDAGFVFAVPPLHTGQHGVCNDIEHDPRAERWRDAALQRGYRAMASLPLRRGERLIGTFNLYAADAGFFDDDEMRLLDELAIDISFALEVHDSEAERHRIEQALRESEDRFRQLAENIQEVFWMTDPGGTQMLYISPAYEKIWGRSCDSLYQSPKAWLDSVHPDDRRRIMLAVERKQTRGDYDETYRIVRPDATVRWIRDRAYPVRGPTGDVVRVVGTAEDITEERQLEEQLRQSQKMEAIGQLAGGVAHDFNNILAAIMMQADLAANVKDQSPDARGLMLEIKSATERAANLTRQLLAFGRRQVMQRRLLNLNEIVTSLTKMLERIVGEDVHLELKLHPHGLLTRADAGMIDQVLLNLVVNARDAMPDGGRLSIETTERVLTEEESAAIPDASPGRHVCVRVSDNGSGIAPRHLPRIFEPFYTTKDQGKGTGLGLATVFGIVKQHGGWVSVDTQMGQGSTFHVYLRASDESEALPVPVGGGPVVKTNPRGGTETILLVEDEPVVRRLTRVVLERAGYRVLEAGDGVEALRLWEEHHLSIQLLLTDIVMPAGVSGRELAARLHARNPRLRVILTSGYSADIAGQELSLKDGQNFIQKPASPQHLLDTVRRSLDR